MRTHSELIALELVSFWQIILYRRLLTHQSARRVDAEDACDRVKKQQYPIGGAQSRVHLQELISRDFEDLNFEDPKFLEFRASGKHMNRMAHRIAAGTGE